MKKRVWHFYIVAILLLCYLLAGCSMKARDFNIESTDGQTPETALAQTDQIDPTEISSSDVTRTPSYFEPETLGEIDFRYIYRGFTAVPLNDSTTLERFLKFGEQIIATEEDWSSFMAFYCQGIPYDEPWNFSEDFLIAYITGSTSPAYTRASAITRLVWEGGHFAPEYENDSENYIYALNSEEYTHFYVEVIAVSKEQQGSIQKENDQASTNGNFKTVYRGFEFISLDDRETFERFSRFGAKVIATEEDWNGFTDTFCPSIPIYETVDFTKHNLIVSIMMGARPTYAVANKIIGIDTEYGCPVFEDSASNSVHALNTENDTHFYIAVIALPREQIADNLEVWTN